MLALVAKDRAVSAPELVELLDGGEQAYPRMLRAIAQATKCVHLEVYAFAPSGVGVRFVTALLQAVRRGVAVQVLLDGWGSARGGRSVAAALRAGGCDVRSTTACFHYSSVASAATIARSFWSTMKWRSSVGST